MAKSHLTAALTLAICCLASGPKVHGQSRVFDEQSGFGTQPTAIQQGNPSLGQQPAAIGGALPADAFGRGQQFGPGQVPGQQANQGQRGFVGSDAQDMRQGFENLSGRQRRRVMFDMMVENLNEMRDQRRQRRERRRRPDPVRVQLRPSFNYQPLNSQQVAADLQSNLIRSADLTGIVAPQVDIVDGTATVSGFVPSEHERAVLAKMISMQPGISKVENRLTVDPFSPSTEVSSGENSPEELPPESPAGLTPE